MLNGIPHCLSPDLVHALMRMGHGEEIVIADANFPAETVNSAIIRADGVAIPPLLDGVLQLLPLDSYSDWQVGLQNTLPGDERPTIWDEYDRILNDRTTNHAIRRFDRFDFYDQARGAVAVVLTGETSLYANIILKKGVVLP